MNNNKMFGEKIERNIRYNQATDTYYVQFTFSPNNEGHLRGFPTLEDARKYRDAINEEKLNYKLQKDLEVIRKKEREEIKNYVPYPYNAFETVNFTAKEIEPYFVDNFEQILDEICVSEKEKDYVVSFFKDGLTLAKIGEKYGVTRERIRQVIAKVMRKFENYIYSYQIKKAFEDHICSKN